MQAVVIVGLTVSTRESAEGVVSSPVGFNVLQVIVVATVIRIAPIGTVGLLGTAVVQYGWQKLGTLAWFVGAIYLGLALVLFAVYPALIKLHGLSVRQYFSGVWPAVQLGFGSRSSMGTLPLTQRVTERSLGVPRE